MNDQLFNAILSMDAYNRGYDPSLSALSGAIGTQIGTASIQTNSTIALGNGVDSAIGFFGVAYDIGGAGTIIAYRGTDDYDGPGDLLTSKDVANGWLLGGGDYDAAQAWMALDFYNEVAGNPVDPRTASISLTGHSLGGGLAGYVASLYGKDALAFDSMAFLTGANLAHIRAVTATGDPAEQALQTRLLAEAYNGLTPWTVDDSGVVAQHIDGEILHATFVRQSPSTQIDMGNNVMGLDSVQLHSQSTLVIRKFADTEIGGATQWREAAKHFWPVLYNDTFAFSVGMNDPGLAGTLQTGGQYADILRMIIAYSAIDNGADSTNARPFGDTGIHALYDDANNLGSALTLAGTSSTIEIHAGVISRAFANFSGQLALHKVLQSTVADATNGILTYSQLINNNTLAVNLSDNYWGLKTGTPLHTADSARFELVTAVLQDQSVSGGTLSIAETLWGNGTYNAFNRVVFAVNQSGTTIIADDGAHADPLKASIFLGSNGSETIEDGTGRDLILAAGGDDVIRINTPSTPKTRNILDGGTGSNWLDDNTERTAAEGNAVIIAGASDSTISDANDVAINIKNFTLDPTQSAYFQIQEMGNSFYTNKTIINFNGQTPADFLTLSYKNYNSSLNFDLTTGVITDASNNTDSYTDNIGTSNFTSVASIVGSDKGDTYNLNAFAFNTTNAFSNAHGMLPIFSGAGNDAFQVDYTIPNAEVQPIFFGGGDDTATGPSPSALNNPFQFIMPIGTTLSDLSYAVENIAIFSDTIDVTNYISDLRVFVDGWGSVLYTNALNASHIKNYDPVPPGDPGQQPHFVNVGDDVAFIVGPTEILSVEISKVFENPSTIPTNLDISTTVFDPVGTRYEDIFDRYHGTYEADTLDLSVYTLFNTFYAYGGDDNVTTGLANDQIFGGEGVDTVIFSGNFANYVITDNGVTVTVQDTVGSDGTDTLSSVELLKFLDGVYVNGVLTSAPIAFNDSFNGTENAPVSGNLLADNGNGADNDPDNNTISVKAGTFSSAQGGSVIVAANGDFTYTPAAGFSGPDSFEYILLDQFGARDIGTVSLSVAPDTNTPPVSVNDAFTGTEDNAVSGNVLADNGSGIDSDPDNHPLSVTEGTFATAQGGSVTISANGDFTYTPASNFNGTDSFTYSVNDGFGGSDTGTVTISLSAVNDAPSVTNNGASLDENTTLTLTDAMLLATDIDNTNAELVFTLVGTPINSDMKRAGVNLSPNDSFTMQDILDGLITFTPDPNQSGAFSFTFSLSDGIATLPNQFFSLSVNPVNDAPVAQADTFTGTEDTSVTGNVLANNGNGVDSDPENDPLSVVAGTYATAQGGSVTISTNGDFTYTPPQDFNGPDTFTYTLSDGNSSDTGTVTINLSAVNDAPVVTNNGAAVNEDTTLSLTTGMLSMADVESAPASRTFTLQSLPSQGTLYLNGVALALAAAFTQQDILDGLVTYTPGANSNGTDSFDFIASDGTASLPSSTFNITVNAVNDPPVAANDSFTGSENTPLNGNLLADNGNGADSDPENQTLSVTAGTFTTAQGGSVTISANGDFTYTPAAGFSGIDSFGYSVNDGNGGSDTGTATINVGAVNAPPVLTNNGATINEDTALVLTSTMLNATDADNTAAQLVFALNAIPANGDLLRNAVVLSVSDTFTMQDVLDGLISYQPEANHNGAAGFTFTVTDGETTLPAETFTITINAVNDAPVAADDAFSGTQDTQITGNVLSDNGNGADSDPENHTLSVTAGTFTTAQGGSITVSTDGGFNYVPLANFNGTDSFAYTVIDGNGGSDTATVTFTVNPALNIINGTAANNIINGTSADDGIYGLAGQDDISGGAGNDVIEGGAGADKMRGEAGDDRIEDLSTDGLVDGYANWFWGGTGNDTMIGGTGNEIYYDGYGGAIGNLIEDAGGIEWYAHMAGGDRVRITDLGGLADKQAIAGNILTHANTTFERYLDSDLVIKNAAGSVHLIYTDQFTDLGNVTGIGVEEIFISGVWLNLKSHILNYAGVMVTRGSDADDVINGITIANTNDEIYAGAGADTVSGDAGDDLLYGELGDDLLNGGAGADTLTGGAGNDTLLGGTDSDNYLFDVGDGHDIITDTGGASDGIHLGVGITQGQLIQTQVGDNLELTFSGNPADKITITNHFAIGGANLVERLIFDDNSEISLVPPSAPPVVTSNGATINEDTALVLNSSLLSATDPDNTAAQLVFALSGIPANGDLLRNAAVLAVSDTFTMQDVLDGLISYQPEANHNGAASFAFTVTDGETTLPATTFGITINAVNDAPVAADDAFTGTQDTQITGNVLSDNGSGADSDPDSDPLTVTPATITTGAGATVVLLATGSFTYTPAAGVTGVDNFIYAASDGNGGSDTATATVTVNPNLNIINGTSANNVLTGTAAADGIYGLAGQDDISGGAGNDVIEGGAGADKMRGEAGDDHIEDLSADGLVDGYANWFWGGTGNDTMLGGTGNDIYYDGYGAANTNLIEDAGGIEWYAHMAGGDQVRITDLGGLADKQAIAGNILTHANTTFERYLDADLVIKNTAGTVHLIYTDQFTDLGNVTGIGVEEIFISGAWLNLKSHILNYAGVMVTRGSDADDVINGITIANTNDEIYAGAGNDTVSGDAGDDVLYGQDGLDQLWGGAGADIFGFEAASAFNDIDTIKDFSVAQGDAIDISDLLFGYDPLTDAITDFVTFTDNAGNSQMSIDRDGTGGAYGAVQVATIENVTGLDAATMETNNNLLAA